MTGKLNYSPGSFRQRLTDDPGCFTGAVILYASGDCCGWLDTGTGPAVGTPAFRGGIRRGTDLALSGKGKYNSSLQPVSCIMHPVSCIMHPVSCILYQASRIPKIFTPQYSFSLYICTLVL